MKTSISVVIAAYNEEKLITQCIEALMNQTLAKEQYEIIVIDNNSSDQTATIAKEMGATVYHYDKKQGAPWAKYYGVQMAQSPLIVFVDADSTVDPDLLEKVQTIMQNANLHCIGGCVMPTTNNPIINGMFIVFNLFANTIQIVGIPLIWGSNMAFRKKSYFEIGGFNTKLKTSDDWEFVMRIQKKFGIRSALYIDRLKVKTSPRKQSNIREFFPYVYIGTINFISIFIFRQSITYGTPTNIR